MSEQQSNYIDEYLAALHKLRDVLTAHGIQIMNVTGFGYAPKIPLMRYGHKEDSSPRTLTIEVAIISTGEAD